MDRNFLVEGNGKIYTFYCKNWAEAKRLGAKKWKMDTKDLRSVQEIMKEFTPTAKDKLQAGRPPIYVFPSEHGSFGA